MKTIRLYATVAGWGSNVEKYEPFIKLLKIVNINNAKNFFIEYPETETTTISNVPHRHKVPGAYDFYFEEDQQHGFSSKETKEGWVLSYQGEVIVRQAPFFKDCLFDVQKLASMTNHFTVSRTINKQGNLEFITPISPIGYHYWIGSQELLKQALSHMDEASKIAALKEFDEINTRGISYKTLDGQHITESKYYNFDEHINAYNKLRTEDLVLARNQSTDPRQVEATINKIYKQSEEIETKCHLSVSMHKNTSCFGDLEVRRRNASNKEKLDRIESALHNRIRFLNNGESAKRTREESYAQLSASFEA